VQKLNVHGVWHCVRRMVTYDSHPISGGHSIWLTSHRWHSWVRKTRVGFAADK